MRRPKLKTISKTLFAASFILTGASCGTPLLPVVIQDQEWCGDEGPLGAQCFHTISPAERAIAAADWDRERVGQVCTKASNFAATKAVIEKLCNETKTCDYQMQMKIKAFFDHVESVRHRTE